jgi:hypothetical protein
LKKKNQIYEINFQARRKVELTIRFNKVPLYILKNTNYTDYRADPNFSISGLETCQNSPEIHFTLNVEQSFSCKKKIKISFDHKDKLLALLIAEARVTDPYIQDEISVTINNNTYENIDKLDFFCDENLPKLLSELENQSTLILYFKDLSD